LKNFHVPSYFYPLAAMLFWGMSFVWTTILLKYYDPLTIILIRLILSVGFLFLLMYFWGKLEKVHKKDYKLVIFSAVFNPFLYFLGENFGLKFSTSTIAAVIIATIPVFSPVVGYAAFREKLSWVNIAGIFVSFAGILVMLMTNGFELSVDPKGVLFLFGAVIAALGYSVTLKKLSVKYSPLTIVGYQNLVGIFFFLPFFFLFEWKKFITVAPNLEIVRSFLFLAILCSSLAYVFYAKSVKIFGISKSNIFTNLIPVFTAIFSFMILSEEFSVQKIIGMGIVIGGVYVSERTKSNDERRTTNDE
jgi:drug/metabolite transporter (DMT)-like permease